MAIPEAALLLSGFVFAHSAWNVSDLPNGDLLCPLAMVETDGKRALIRFPSESQDESIRLGKAQMAEATKHVDAWAFAREGLMAEKDGKVDVLTVDFWAKGMAKPATLIQKFEPYAKNKHFRLLGDPFVLVDGVPQKADTAKDLLKVISRGISQHSQAQAQWNAWHSK